MHSGHSITRFRRHPMLGLLLSGLMSSVVNCAHTRPPTVFVPQQLSAVRCYWTDGHPLAFVDADSVALVMSLERCRVADTGYMRLWLLCRNLSDRESLLDPMQVTAMSFVTPSGVWDGVQYLITWTNGAAPEHILGCRLAADGFVHDPTPFVIHDGEFGRAALASASTGRVLAGYLGDTVRGIDDSLPITGNQGPPLPAHDRGIGTITPNPGRGQLHLGFDLAAGTRASGEVFDVAGRSLRRFSLAGAGWTWDGRLGDGRAAPTGLYFFRISVPGGEPVVRRGILIQ